MAVPDSSVAGLVGLDGGIGTPTARASCLLRSLTSAERWTVEAPALHHHQFTDLGAATIGYPSLRPALGGSAETARPYASVARATLDFLDAFPRRDPAARRRIGRGGGWPALGRLERLR